MKSNVLLSALVIVVLFVSCNPEEPPSPYNRKATGYIYLEKNGVMAPGIVRCAEPGTNCWTLLQEGDVPVYYRGTLSALYDASRNNDLAAFFANYPWQQLFPPESRINEDAVQNIISGRYSLQVLADSSVVILANPAGGLRDENILYAIDRNCLPY